MASLAEIRAKLAAAESRNSNNSSNSRGPSALYPHWNILEGQTATVRFLEDGNSKNTFFWVEQNTIRLPFAGIKGQSPNKITVTVPCIEMFGETCPILTEVRPWYKDESLKELANSYWKKRQYHFQGFVRDNPMSEETPPENPIRRFSMTPQLFNVIKAALMDPDIAENPTDREQGLDFRITKTQKGQFANYDTSSWARRESALNDFERQAIETYGLFDLSSFLPKRPTEEELKVLHRMFEASVDGQAWDPDLWGDYFRPYGWQGGSAPDSGPDQTVAPPVAHAAIKEPAAKSVIGNTKADDTPWEEDVKEAEATFKPAPRAEAAESATKPSTDEILAMIRQRQQKS